MSTAQLAASRLRGVIAQDRVERQVHAELAKAGIPAIKARAHEATRSTRQRKLATDWGSANRIVGQDAYQLRTSARDMVRNHDVARTVLTVLVQNVVGSGIDVMPAPRQRGGQVDRALAQDLRDLWDEWWDRPEVTWQHDFGKCQQLLASGWFRDGEAFFQSLAGPVSFLDHGTAVPLSLELLEADLVPLDFTDPDRGILQGVERNTWGRVTAYHVYKQHPGDTGVWKTETKRVPAEQMRQLANIERIHQVRGLSVFAPVINRLRDIQDYEDSERIAAKVAASLCAQIIKGDPGSYAGADAGAVLEAAVVRDAYRALTMVPGLIGDDLLPGEKIELIDSKRPNPNVATYINDQLRRVAGGTGTAHSSVSKNYSEATYSGQRQELVEQWGAYAMLGEQFTARVMRPTWGDFVNAALLIGLVKMPRGWTPREVAAATFVRPVMPWIDPLKEAQSRALMEDRGWQAPQQSILQMGNDPEEVQRLREDWDAQQPVAPATDPPPADPSTDDPSTDDLPADQVDARRVRRNVMVDHALKDTNA